MAEALGAIRYAARALRGSIFITLPVTPRVRRDFKLDLIAAILFGMFNGSVIGYLYVVGRTIGVSPVGISVLVAMPAIGSILALPISLLIRGPGARPFMLGVWTVGRGVMILTVLSSSPMLYILVASAFQISTSIASPFYAAVMEHVYPREFRGQLMSLVRIGSGTATTLTSLLVAALLGAFHVRFGVIFAVGTLLTLLSLAVFSRITPVDGKPRPRRSLRESFSILKRNPRFAEYQLAVFIMGFGNIMAFTLYPLVIVDKLHGGYGAYGVLTVCTSLGYLISFFIWGRIVDRKGPMYTMLVVGISAVGGPILMLLAPGVYWLIPAALLAGINTAGFELGVYSAVIHFAFATPQEVPHYMAVHSYFSGVRGITAPFLATAILAGHHYNLALSAAILCAGAGTALLWSRVRAQQTVADEVAAAT